MIAAQWEPWTGGPQMSCVKEQDLRHICVCFGTDDWPVLDLSTTTCRQCGGRKRPIWLTDLPFGFR